MEHSGSNLNLWKFPVFKLILFCIIPFLLLSLITHRYGIGVSPDSTHFLSTALNFNQEFDFKSSITSWEQSSEKAYQPLWPPLYPLILSVLFILPLDQNFLLTFINSILLCISLLLTEQIVSEIFGKRKALNYFILFFTVYSLPLLYVYSFVWTEVLFIPLFLSTILIFIRLKKSYDDKKFILLCCCIIFLGLTRYIGFVFFLLPLQILIINRRNKAFSISKPLIIYIISILIPGFLFFLNLTLTGYFTGERIPADVGIAGQFIGVGTSVSKLFFPVSFGDLILYAGSILLIIIVTKLVFLKNKIFNSVLIIIIIYLVSLSVISAKIKIDSPGIRLLSPVYIPLFILLSISLWSIKRVFFRIMILIMLCIMLVYKPSKFILNSYSDGPGEYSTKRWAESETIEYLSNIAGNPPILSNYADAINYFTKYSTKQIPASSSELDEFIKIYRNKKFILCWLKSDYDRTEIKPEVLTAKLNVTSEFNFNDGSVYFINEN